MILVWNSIKSFQQHLEEMKQFRQSHNNVRAEEIKMLKVMPMPFDVTIPRETGLIKSLFDSKGKLVLVPIWKINVSKGSQN
jgi:hypothetical protein